MTAPPPTASAKRGTAQPCGCPPPDTTACTLECLERPLFTCGQLLTDQDLMALVTWAQKKMGLARYRHGWGVVCGFDVRCDPDPKNEGQVIVGPGYAVNCCGDDMILCQDTPYNLAACCQPKADVSGAKPAQAAEAAESSFGGLPVSGARALDLFIRYKEVGGSARTAFGGANCPPPSACVFTRTKETSWIDCKIATVHDPRAAAAEKWEEGYSKCLNVVRRFREVFGPEAHGEHVADWLLKWIEGNPLRQFGFVTDFIRHHRREFHERVAVHALFWLVQDCRNAFLECGCYECDEDCGTPIARVWVRPGPTVRGKPSCRILGIDTRPPHRRLLGQECWPEKSGHINVGQAIWLFPNDAARSLAQQGAKLGPVSEWSMPESAAGLEKALDSVPVVPWDSLNRLQVFDAAGMGYRVVGITR